jgi:hypothetical protein
MPRELARCMNVRQAAFALMRFGAQAHLDGMEIRFISSLTAEDEELYAPAVLKAVTAFLDHLPIAYTIRVETSGSRVFQHTHVAPEQVATGAEPNGHGLAADVVSPYGVRGRYGT